MEDGFKLERLPWLALNRICDYLIDDASRSLHPRCDLAAFSLTSKWCCALTAPQRFCEIVLEATESDTGLNCAMEKWIEVLDRDGGRYHYVRRLKSPH
ncbi:hypothetical protein QBC34DRAFT_402830 [Podospora aff. communis PSN243]|uniref:F-box domain-containing protein n=1 Tax=Podospora aff. communis PSN243 TaxID=3040156 RepID=A0AAV9GRY9_9PEZI|nr:hypothetical protein QBC34DRAFT_402830 [Podospora aff. communis PSN243]